MDNFIGRLSNQILESEKDIRTITVVLPTQRASTYLVQNLIDKLPQNSWLPKTTTLNNWVSNIANIVVANPIELKFHFYEAYKNVMKSEAQSLTDCFSWCDVLIGDFNNIDSQLISSDLIFKELVDYNEIEHFSFLDEPLSMGQERYRQFWKQLPKIHSEFKRILKVNKLGYPGMILIEAVKNAPAYFKNSKDHTIVAGLNALSLGESTLLKMMETEGLGEVIFDADAYYLDNPIHHAGHFIRNNARNGLGKTLNTETAFDQRPISIEICQADFNFQQAEIASGLLAELSTDQLSKTALVLADEGLLIPVLSTLPTMEKGANITMGIGIQNSPFSSWLESLFELPNHIFANQGIRQVRNDKVHQFFGHHFSRKISSAPYKLDIPEHGLSDEATINSKFEKAPKWAKETAIFIFSNDENRLKTLRAFCIEIASLLESSNDGSIPFIQSAKAIEVLLQSLNQSEKFNSGGFDIATLRKISSQALKSVNADLLGDPTDSLQIMGLLESRALSFERVIICSVNENVLPKKAANDSFIPFEIAQFHKLPGKKEKEAVYAYHFYRLIQHAEHLHLIYHTNKEGLNGGEKSRYIQQLEFELAKKNKQAEIKYRNLELTFNPEKGEEYIVKKSDRVLELIKGHIEKRISATSINAFIDDPLNWFYTSVLKLQEPASEGIDSANFGTLVHKVLEDLYLPYTNKIISLDILLEMKLKAIPMLEVAVKEDVAWHNPKSGSDAVFYRMAEMMILGYLEAEKKLVEGGDVVTFVAAEAELKKELEVETSHGKVKTNFVGFVDRVERRNGILHIVDYKTGMVTTKDLSKKELLFLDKSHQGKVLQLALYHWMANNQYDEKSIVTEILSLPKPNDRTLRPKFSLDKDETAEGFELYLQEIVQSMLDSATDIVKNPKFDYAKFE